MSCCAGQVELREFRDSKGDIRTRIDGQMVDGAFVLNFDMLFQFVKKGFAAFLLPNHFDIINVNSDEEMISDVDAGI
jgi:hypothetical protein